MNTPKILHLYREKLERGLSEVLRDPTLVGESSRDTDPLYPILRYHVGLCDENGRAVKALGKMLRPSLLLFTTQELGGDLDRAIPAALHWNWCITSR